MSHSVPTEKTNIPSSSALWAVLIFIGLILAAINFVKAENSGEGHGEAATEHVESAPATEAAPVTETAKPAAEATTPAEKDTTKAATEETHH